jgi:hypothetical protein
MFGYEKRSILRIKLAGLVSASWNTYTDWLRGVDIVRAELAS